MIRLKKFTITVAILSALAIFVGTASANLITNGDFELGNVSFTSEYIYFAKPATPASGYTNPKSSLYDEGTYGVGTDPGAYHVSWAHFGDHTTGTGNMMIVNGATATTGGDVEVWSSPQSPDTISVVPGTMYYFSAWVTSVYPPPVGSPAIAPAELAFSINGTELVPDIYAGQTGTWSLFYRSWVADSTYANLSLINRTTVVSGNDFAIDDISLSTSNPAVPIPAAVWLLGSGLLGLIGIRRRYKK